MATLLPNLKTLSVTNCQNLTTLDLSQCVNLVELDASVCSLDKMTLTGCANLVSLDCHMNRLTSLDMSAGFPNLKSLICNDQTRGGLDPEEGDDGWTIDLSEWLSAVKVESEAVTVASVGIVADSVKGYDGDEKEIARVSYDEATGTAKFSSQPEKVTYDYDTGFKASGASADTLMDVTLTGGGTDGGSNSGAHSGCDSGLGLMALAAILPALVRKGRK